MKYTTDLTKEQMIEIVVAGFRASKQCLDDIPANKDLKTDLKRERAQAIFGAYMVLADKLDIREVAE